MLKKWLKLSHHRHTGRLRPHEHTSYLPLGIVLAIVGFVLSAYTALAATPYTGPESGSVGLHGVMPGKPPTVAATIKSPANGQHFSTSPVTVSGSCPKNTLVEIFKNDIFAGSTPCQDDGTYSVDVDLLIGQNVLVARVYDDLDQPGPDSNSVTVYYDALPPQAGPLSSLDFGGPQMILNTTAVFRGTFPGQELKVPLTIVGGIAPYAVNILWGDTENTVVSRKDNITFDTVHTYKKAGVYQIRFQATDADGRVAFLTVAAIVNGQPDVVASAATSSTPNSTLLALWPLYTASVAVVISFWLGEWRERAVLSKRGALA